jgi:protein gp37
VAKETGISWADSTANLWIGCQKVSRACDHCYAEDLMGTEGSRLKRVQWGPHGQRIHCKQGWSDVKKWQKVAAANVGVDPELGRRRRVFVNSLSDFFDNHPSVKWRGEAWNLIRRSPHVIFMLVTKRPQLIARYLPPFWNEIAERVWLLTTAEDQTEAERRIPALLESCMFNDQPAVFGVSCEPLLGPIEMRPSWLIPPPGKPGLGWVIAGGESGKQARPMSPLWAEHLQQDCAAAEVPFHFKQWGEWADASWLGDGSRLWTVMSHESNGDKDTVAWPDGTFSHGVASDHGGRGVRMIRDGKVKAGHLLAGREYREIPNVA